MAARRKKRTKTIELKPVRVNAAVVKSYRDKLQASNIQFKKQVDKKAKAILARIAKLDRTKPGAFQKENAKLMKQINSLSRNLAAANKRSVAAVDVFVNKMERENTRRTGNVFKRAIDLLLQKALLIKKSTILNRRTDKLRKKYKESITRANLDYLTRVNGALLSALGNSEPNALKKARATIVRARGIVTRRIKNTTQNHAHETNATLNRVKARALGAKQYVWWSRQDDKVRTIHAEHSGAHGKIFTFGQPPAETNGFEPGEDFGCRCVAKPLVEVRV